ncbi:MAG: hypothetical protein JWO80_1724 [Bryobacterales bacterium]|nr:hypothetical protein [Bryobacterales bacterium]
MRAQNYHWCVHDLDAHPTLFNPPDRPQEELSLSIEHCRHPTREHGISVINPEASAGRVHSSRELRPNRAKLVQPAFEPSTELSWSGYSELPSWFTFPPHHKTPHCRESVRGFQAPSASHPPNDPPQQHPRRALRHRLRRSSCPTQQPSIWCRGDR